VARSSYVHPEIVEAFETERLPVDLLKGRQRDGLTRVETGLMRFLEEVARQAH
jgi:DNA topoisomerase-1